MPKVHLRDRQKANAWIVVHDWIKIISFGKKLEKKKPEYRIHPVMSLTEEREFIQKSFEPDKTKRGFLLRRKHELKEVTMSTD